MSYRCDVSSPPLVAVILHVAPCALLNKQTLPADNFAFSHESVVLLYTNDFLTNYIIIYNYHKALKPFSKVVWWTVSVHTWIDKATKPIGKTFKMMQLSVVGVINQEALTVYPLVMSHNAFNAMYNEGHCYCCYSQSSERTEWETRETHWRAPVGL